MQVRGPESPDELNARLLAALKKPINDRPRDSRRYRMFHVVFQLQFFHWWTRHLKLVSLQMDFRVWAVSHCLLPPTCVVN